MYAKFCGDRGSPVFFLYDFQMYGHKVSVTEPAEGSLLGRAHKHKRSVYGAWQVLRKYRKDIGWARPASVRGDWTRKVKTRLLALGWQFHRCSAEKLLRRSDHVHLSHLCCGHHLQFLQYIESTTPPLTSETSSARPPHTK